LRTLAELGCHVIDADDIARTVVAPGSVGLKSVTQAFGEDFLQPDGALDRAKLGAIVFSDEQRRAQLNSILHRDGIDNRFATLFYFEVDPATGRLRYLNAGHNPPFVLRASGSETLEASAIPLGMMDGTTYEEGGLRLEKGDVLVVYSDGLTEATNASDQEFGPERLRALLPRLRGLNAEQAVRLVIGEVTSFLDGERPHDDLSLVVLVHPGDAAAATGVAPPPVVPPPLA